MRNLSLRYKPSQPNPYAFRANIGQRPQGAPFGTRQAEGTRMSLATQTHQSAPPASLTRRSFRRTHTANGYEVNPPERPAGAVRNLPMSLRKIRWTAAAVIAWLMGFPLAEKALADNSGDIVSAAVSLAIAIVDVAGDS